MTKQGQEKKKKKEEHRKKLNMAGCQNVTFVCCARKKRFSLILIEDAITTSEISTEAYVILSTDPDVFH